jgi:hypothetical protein
MQLMQPAQLPEIKVARPLQAYFAGQEMAKQEKMQEQQAMMQERQMQMQEQQMQMQQAKLQEYEQDAPMRQRQKELELIKTKMETDKTMTEFGRQKLLTLDPDAEDFDQQAMNAAVEFERYLVEEVGVSPETAEYVMGTSIKAGAFTRESVLQQQIKAGIRPEPGKAEKPELDKASGQQFRLNPETGEYEASGVKGFKKPDKPQATPDTDQDDYVSDMAAQYEMDTGRKATPGQRAGWRLEHKRVQAAEAGAVASAKEGAKADFAEVIARNSKLGQQLAEIDTTAQMLEAKGEVTPKEKQQRARGGIENRVSQMASLYLQLDTMGGMINTRKRPIENIWAAAKSSDTGQAIGNMLGIDEQSFRKQIVQIKPLLINDIRQASEMGARGMDTERELAFYLQAVSDEKADIDSAMAALMLISETYGLGQVSPVLRGEIPSKSLEQMLAGAEKAKNAPMPKGAVAGGVNPETGNMEYFDAQGNKL